MHISLWFHINLCYGGRIICDRHCGKIDGFEEFKVLGVLVGSDTSGAEPSPAHRRPRGVSQRRSAAGMRSCTRHCQMDCFLLAPKPVNAFSLISLKDLLKTELRDDRLLLIGEANQILYR